MLLDDRQRFANPPSEHRGELTQDVQHVFFPSRLKLLLVEDISGVAALGSESEHVLVPEARDRSPDDTGASRSDANVACDLVGQPRAWRLSHQLQGLANALVGNDAQKRRLLELHGEPLSERLIEYRIARPVG